MDGIKYYFEGGSSLSIRILETEPLLRIFVGTHAKENNLFIILSIGTHSGL